MQFNLVRRGDTANITVVVDGELYTADEQHPLFDEIVEAAIDGDEAVVDLFDTSKPANKALANLSDRVRVEYGRVVLDGNEVDGVYADQILRFVEDGVDDWKPLVKFLEKVADNKNRDIRVQLGRWLTAQGSFSILPNGNLVGYRGLNSDFTSVHSGPGIVNGERQNAHLDNAVGNVVEIDLDLVEVDPSVGCAAGLHVGTEAYARNWSRGKVVTVEVDPRHIRSIPFESSDAKMRVSRYRVLDDVTSVKVETPAVDYSYDEDYGDWYDDEDGYDY